MTRILQGPRVRLVVAVLLLAAATRVGGAARPANARPPAPDALSADAPPAPIHESARVSASRVTIQAREYAYDAPSTISSGLVTFTLQNVGTDDHLAQFLKLNDGVTDDRFRAAVQTARVDEVLAVSTPAGGANAVPPGSAQDVTFDMAAGNYFMLCYVAGEDDPTLHAVKGMVRPFQVAAPSSEATAPVADLTVTMHDFSYTAPTITAGARTVQVVNRGAQPHAMTLVRVSDSSDPADGSREARSSNAPDPTRATFAGGIAVIAPGGSGWATVNFTPGLWMMVCFVPDNGSGPTHAALGMSELILVE